MKFIIQREDLTSLIGRVQGVVPSKAVIPILSNVLVEADGNQVILTATDLTVSIQACTNARVEETGAITLPARRFFSLVRELTTPEVEISVGDDGVAVILAGSSHFRLHGMNKDEFPSFPDLTKESSFAIDNGILKEMLSKTAFAAAKDDSRQVLNGIYFALADSKALIVATDGKKLAKIEKTLEIDSQEMASSIIPLKAVDEMQKLIDEDETSTISLGEDKIGVETSHTKLVSKLIAGEFPDYERVIPDEENITRITIHREELSTLLKQVSLFTSENSHSVKLTFENGSLSIQAMSSQIGEGKVQMPVDFHKESIEIAFNPHFFLDILRHCKDETINFGLIDSYNPGSIQDSSDSQFVLMPMRILQEV